MSADVTALLVEWGEDPSHVDTDPYTGSSDLSGNITVK